MKKITLLFAILLVFGLTFAGISVSNYTVSKSSFKPGDNGVVTLTISNPMISSTVGYRMTGVSVSYFPPAEITSFGITSIGDIDAGGSTIVSIPIRIKKTASSGIYLFQIKLAGFSAATTTTGQDVYAKSFSIPITVADEPILTFVPNKKVIGGIDSLTFKVTNNGGAAKNVRITLPSTSSVALYGTNEFYFSEIKGTTMLNLTLDSRNATDGPTNVPLELNYEDEIGSSHSETNNIRMTVRNDVLDLTFTQQTSLMTRKEGKLSLKIKNNGESLKDVRLSFTNTSVRLKNVNELKVGDLNAGAEGTTSGTVFADIQPGLNLISAKITWVEKDVRKEQLLNIPITISSDASVAVYLEAKPTPLTIGKEHTISVLVSNLGSYGIDNVDVSFSSSALTSLDISESQYIGSLDHDDFSTVQFKVKSNTIIPGTYDSFVNVTYRDKSGEWKTKSIKKSITLHTGTKGDGNTSIFLVLIVVAAIVVWYFKFRRQKNLSQPTKR